MQKQFQTTVVSRLSLKLGPQIRQLSDRSTVEELQGKCFRPRALALHPVRASQKRSGFSRVLEIIVRRHIRASEFCQSTSPLSCSLFSGEIYYLSLIA